MNTQRVAGIEPACAAWKAAILPLNYTRTRSYCTLCPVKLEFKDFTYKATVTSFILFVFDRLGGLKFG